MSKVNDLVLDIVKGRKEAKKRKEIVEKAAITDYAYEILKAFKISNEEEESTILLWQLKLYGRKFSYMSLMMAFEKGEGAAFYNCKYLEQDKCKKYLLGNNERLKGHIENLNIPSKAFGELYKYFKEEFSENLIITKKGEAGDEELIIELKD